MSNVGPSFIDRYLFVRTFGEPIAGIHPETVVRDHTTGAVDQAASAKLLAKAAYYDFLTALPDMTIIGAVRGGRETPGAGHVIGGLAGLVLDAVELVPAVAGTIAYGAAALYRSARAVFD